MRYRSDLIEAMGRPVQLSIGLLILITLVIAAGAVYQTIAIARDQRRYPPRGQRIDVGGYRLHL